MLTLQLVELPGPKPRSHVSSPGSAFLQDYGLFISRAGARVLEYTIALAHLASAARWVVPYEETSTRHVSSVIRAARRALWQNQDDKPMVGRGST